MASADNATDQDGSALVSAYFGPATERQFARRMWVPPHAHRTTWLPIQVPSGIAANVQRQELTTLALDEEGDRELLRRREGDLLTSNMPLPITHDAGNMGSYFRKPLAANVTGADNPDEDAWDTALAARKSAELNASISDLSSDFQPPWPESLRGLEQILLTADRITNDSAGIAVLRSWLRGGGRLWICLDRVEPSTVEAILGNAVNFQVVDRVQLDRFELESVDLVKRERIKEPCDFEDPVDFVRIVHSSSDVVSWVDGWPAAFWVPFGEGEVLITTLGPRGWRAPKTERPTIALQTIAGRLFANREGRVDPQAFQSSLQQQIGYRVPSRSIAMSVLGGYCFALLASGGILAKRKRLDALAWLVPGITITATVALVAIGIAHTTSVPSKIALGQLLEIAPQTNEARVTGLAAIYDHRSQNIDLTTDHRNWLIPSVSDPSAIQRLVWSDDDRVTASDMETNAGSIGFASMHGQVAMLEHVALEAEFNESGLVGKLRTGELGAATDAVIVAPPAPALAVALNDDGDFTANEEQVLSAEQYIASTLMTDEQRRRQDYFRALLNPSDTFVFPRRPSVFFWCNPVDIGIRMPEGFLVAGSALAVVPLEIRRTPPDTAFRVPSTFLEMTAAQGQAKSSAYNRRTGQWVKGLTVASETPLRFQLPAEVLPCELSTATLTIRINAPSRELQVKTYRTTDSQVVRAFRSPIGVIALELKAGDLQLDAAGGLTLGLAIGPTGAFTTEADGGSGAGTDASSLPSNIPTSTIRENNPWQIEYVRLTVAGRTSSASE
ncbi:MAG: hypothetical protein RIS70_3607 [Planctomycetota bacterium]